MAGFTEEQLAGVRDAAAKLNPEDDAHWNAAGQPNCNVLKELCGFPVTKAMIAEAGVESRPSTAPQADATAPTPEAQPEPKAKAKEPAETPKQATLAECNAKMREVEAGLKKQANEDRAAKAQAFIDENS